MKDRKMAKKDKVSETLIKDALEEFEDSEQASSDNSNAQVAYGTAVDQAVTGGFGFFRIDIDYAHQNSFDLQAQIKRIPNALSVHWDTASSEFDASDWRYAFISDHLSKEEYKKLYPKASMVAWDAADIGGDSGNWLDDDQIRVSEYFKRVETKRKLFKFSVPNPETGEADIQTAKAQKFPPATKMA